MQCVVYLIFVVATVVVVVVCGLVLSDDIC